MSTKLVTSASVSKSESSKSIMDPQVNGVQGPVKSDADKSVLLVIDSLKKKVAEDRCAFVKEKIEQSRQKMIGITNNIFSFSNMRRHSTKHEADNNVNLLSKRMQDALCMLNGSDISYGKKYLDDQQDSHAPVVLLGSNFGATNAIRPIKLPEVAKLPPYTTWIFLDRNQRMTDDQSVVGRRRIYYDQNGGEALICSDSEEEIVEDEEEKKEFRNAEDFIIRMTIEEAGLSDAVLDSLGECFSRKPCEIKARYESLKGEIPQCSKMEDTKDEPKLEELFADKNLEAAQDSLDNLFCRRCLVFDCRLHGCSQDLVFPAEKQRPWSPPDAEKVPCDRQCYLLTLKAESIATGSCSMMPDEENPMPSFRTGGQKSHRRRTVGSSCGKRTKSNKSESASSNARNISESSESEIRPHQDKVSTQKSSRTSPVKAKLASKGIIRNRLLLSTQQASDRALRCMQKRQKKLVTSDSDSVVSGAIWTREMKLRSNSRKENGDASSSSQMKVKSPRLSMSRKESSVKNNNKLVPVEGDDESSDEVDNDDNLGKDEFVGENIYRNEGDKSWKPIEKSLFLKGIEIFGKNSCLIARNLLCDMKTCTDIFQYMNFTENKQSYGADDGADSEGQSKVDYNDALGGKLRTRSRFIRRRGKVRRLKYTWKSAGYNSIRKRITDKKDQPYRQYNPCGCQSACGKQCPCHLNGTCCEKYCGCPKSCKNRFRGCHCAKSQCRSRQCPCFAAGRECDSDVCRNCWVGCGDGAFGGPSQSGDNYECRNMKLLLKQQQRVLLGRSDVSGWGAFLKNSVSKHEYLGEYTGELISHREADKRGKIYDRENSSFLFNLNDKFVLDAYRRGDKLKFANHSPNPNCYAKVIMVGGDHRVGIFANERINAGEELFYDYRYEPDRAPAWAKKSDAPGLKKDEVGPSNGRAKKCPKG